MKTLLQSTFAVCLAAFLVPAQGASIDLSYDPNPSLFDQDKNAQFDSFSLLALAIGRSVGMVSGQQNFENGFSAGQVLNDWVSLGGTRMRFGFGDSLSQIQWQGTIGQVDPNSAAYGLNHPHGTYGNAPGVANDPRNYVADHYFLTGDPTAGATTPSYLVIQFEQAISFIAFTMIDYASRTGGASNFSVWNGTSVGSAVELDPIAISSRDGTVLPGTPDGDFDYLIGGGTPSGTPPYLRPTFNFAVLRLNAGDSTVGFDNFFAAAAPVPEPQTYALTGLGVLLLAARARRARG